MIQKWLPAVLVMVLAGLLAWMIFLYYRQPTPETKTEVHIQRVSYPVETRVIRESVPAQIDTIYIDREPHAIAKYQERIEKDKTTVDLNIQYDERDRLFSVDARVVSIVDSVFVEKEIVRVIERKPRLVALTSGVQIGGRAVDGLELANAGIDVGVRLAGKYSVSLFANSDKVFGVRFGIDF